MAELMNKLRNFLPVIIAIVLFVLLLFGVTKAVISHEDKLWNNGHCNICGGTWEYEQAVGHRTSTSHIYVCRKCGKRIELYEVR